MLDDCGAVIIHHRRLEDIAATVEQVHLCGIALDALLVVDNSDSPEVLESLRKALPEEVEVLSVENRGYGAAANQGISVLESSGRFDFLLVATHEVRPSPSSVAAMRQAMLACPSAGVSGPTLVTGEAIWSHGGYLSPVLKEPRHHILESPGDSNDPQLRDWVDGAFCLYRTAALSTTRFREDFFMYFEETELHARLRTAGWQVLWVPEAVVNQSSDGVPPYLLTRNLALFLRAHGGGLASRVTVPWIMLRASARKAARGGKPRERRDMWRGWRESAR